MDSLFEGRPKGTDVTACDIETGESETQTIRNDYCLVTDGKCEVKTVSVLPNGDHVIVVKGAQRG